MSSPTVQEVIETYEIIEESVSFAESLVFEEENVTGTRYRYILSEENEEGA